jgi:hypothetical protein
MTTVINTETGERRIVDESTEISLSKDEAIIDTKTEIFTPDRGIMPKVESVRDIVIRLEARLRIAEDEIAALKGITK